MTFEDLHLDRPPAPGPSRSRAASPTRWIMLAAGAVIVGALLTLWWMSRTRPTPATPAPTKATEAALGPQRPKAQVVDLPSLDESDTFLRDMVAALSRHPTLAKFLATKSLVRGATLAVIQIGDGKTPATPLSALRPLTRTQILGATSGRIDPVSYVRWDGATGALTSVDPIHAAQLYVTVKPLFDQAYQELGNPNREFDEAIARAIRTLDETPQITADPSLLRRPSYYEHEDPKLRSLLPVQKQLLLVGPDNRRKIMQWLKQLATNLDLKI
ncbi:MAG TPA: DUF3014 domain-containing protein [Vicinamibacterales bacterium]|nr:DUF3014 domain-containing protein [Vicinamibacterales bacterium]